MNTQTTHTPGPWSVETRMHVHAILDCAGQEIAFQDTHPQADAGSVTSRGRTPEETQANAHLIKAAPDLLHAARLANEELIALGVGSSGSPALRALWWAIARAEGKEP